MLEFAQDCVVILDHLEPCRGGEILGVGAREAVFPADERCHAFDQRKIIEKKVLPVHWLARGERCVSVNGVAILDELPPVAAGE